MAERIISHKLDQGDLESDLYALMNDDEEYGFHELHNLLESAEITVLENELARALLGLVAGGVGKKGCLEVIFADPPFRHIGGEKALVISKFRKRK